MQPCVSAKRSNGSLLSPAEADGKIFNKHNWTCLFVELIVETCSRVDLLDSAIKSHDHHIWNT